MGPLTTVPLKGRYLDVLLSLLVLRDDQEDASSTILPHETHERVISHVLEMCRTVKASQSSLLETTRGVLARHLQSYIRTEDVAALLICINKALDLPCEQPGTAQIRALADLVLQTRQAVGKMWKNNSSLEEKRSAALEADQTVKRLKSHLIRMPICGGQNRRMLFCAHSRDGRVPALGWMGPYDH
jgi:hypothetical protein